MCLRVHFFSWVQTFFKLQEVDVVYLRVSYTQTNHKRFARGIHDEMPLTAGQQKFSIRRSASVTNTLNYMNVYVIYYTRRMRDVGNGSRHLIFREGDVPNKIVIESLKRIERDR